MVDTIFSANRQKALTPRQFIHSFIQSFFSSSTQLLLLLPLLNQIRKFQAYTSPTPQNFPSAVGRYPPRKKGQRERPVPLLRAYSNFAKLFSARPPYASEKRGYYFTRYLLFLIKQTEKYSNIQVPLPPTVPPRRYLLTLEALPSHSSRGIEQGQGRGACTRYMYVCHLMMEKSWRGYT